MQSQHERGVTLIEMVVVLTIIAVMSAVVFPSATTGLDNMRLKSSADRLAHTLRYARERAVRSQTTCQVRLDPRDGSIEIEDVAEPGAGRRAQRAERRGWQLPEGIRMRMERPRSFLFLPDGTVPGIRVVLANDRGRTASVEIDPLAAIPVARLNRVDEGR